MIIPSILNFACSAFALLIRTYLPFMSCLQMIVLTLLSHFELGSGTKLHRSLVSNISKASRHKTTLQKKIPLANRKQIQIT